MKIDRISRIGNISDAKLFPNKVVFLSVRHYVTFQWRPQLLGEKYFWHVTTSIMYKQVHNVSPGPAYRVLQQEFISTNLLLPKKKFWSDSRWCLCFPEAGLKG